MTATETAALPDVPLAVLEYALKRNKAQHIPTVLEAVGVAFPTGRIRLYVEEDPEAVGESRIIIDVRVPDVTPEQVYPADAGYHDRILELVPPSDYVGTFCLRVGGGA